MAYRVLDLFCGAGAAAKGYANAGFEVIGVDWENQPRYPFEFHMADAMEVAADKLLLDWLDISVIHASPPCQSYSSSTMHLAYPRAKLIEPLRELLKDSGRVYIIENVPGAPMDWDHTITLCGSMFGKRFRRHRHFECNVDLVMPPWSCDHSKPALDVYGNASPAKWKEWQFEMFDNQRWMIREEAKQAIPICYTDFIAVQVMEVFKRI